MLSCQTNTFVKFDFSYDLSEVEIINFFMNFVRALQIYECDSVKKLGMVQQFIYYVF